MKLVPFGHTGVKISAVGLGGEGILRTFDRKMEAQHYILPKMNITAEQLIRYSLSSDIALPIIGCSTPEEVRAVVSAERQKIFSETDKKIFEDKFKSYASRLAFYRGVL